MVVSPALVDMQSRHAEKEKSSHINLNSSCLQLGPRRNVKRSFVKRHYLLGVVGSHSLWTKEHRGNTRLFQMEESEPKVEPEEQPTGNEFDRSGVKNLKKKEDEEVFETQQSPEKTFTSNYSATNSSHYLLSEKYIEANNMNIHIWGKPEKS